MIYRQVLVSTDKVKHISSRIGLWRLERKMAGSYAAISDIDSTILRSCRAIYTEALPVLYGENVFCFSAPNDIACFMSVSFERKSCSMSSYSCELCAYRADFIVQKTISEPASYLLA